MHAALQEDFCNHKVFGPVRHVLIPSTVGQHPHGPEMTSDALVWPDTRHTFLACSCKTGSFQQLFKRKLDLKKSAPELCSDHRNSVHLTSTRLLVAWRKHVLAIDPIDPIFLKASIWWLKCCKSSTGGVPCHLSSLSSTLPVQLVAITGATGRAGPCLTEGRQGAASSPALYRGDSNEGRPLT